MSKTIKVSQGTYDRLVELMKPRETFDNVVNRLIDARIKAGELLNAIEGSARFREHQEK